MNREPPKRVWLHVDRDGDVIGYRYGDVPLTERRPAPEGSEFFAYTHGWPDDPSLDATDGAHPAWWRGHDHGANKAAEAIIAVIMSGKHAGTFATGAVEAAAVFARGMVLGWEHRLASLAKECALLAEQGALSNNTVTELEKRILDLKARIDLDEENEVMWQKALDAHDDRARGAEARVLELESTTRELRSRLEACAFNLNAAEERAMKAEARVMELETELTSYTYGADERATTAEARVLELEDQLEIYAPLADRLCVPDDDEIPELTAEQIANAKPLWQARVAMAFIAWAGRFRRD